MAAAEPSQYLADMTTDPIDQLYKSRKGKIDFLRIPKLLIAAVDGVGDPEGQEFAAAIGALYSVSYTAKFAVKQAGGEPPKVMPLEAQWWIEGVPISQWADVPRDTWHWRAFIVQRQPLTVAKLRAAQRAAAAKQANPTLDRLVFEQYTEGLVAQTLHVGPYAGERPTIDFLHAGILAAGYQLTGRHHEIYLGDPRKSDPAKLRTLLRQPIVARK